MTLDEILGLHRVRLGMWVKLPSWNNYYRVIEVETSGAVSVWAEAACQSVWYPKSKMGEWVIKKEYSNG